MGRGKTIEKIYQFEGSTLKKEWTLSPVMSIPSSFAFDFANNRFYAGYFEAATVEVFDLATGNKPSSESPGGVKGRCGDDICQPIEKEKGVCPEDCKQ